MPAARYMCCCLNRRKHKGDVSVNHFQLHYCSSIPLRSEGDGEIKDLTRLGALHGAAAQARLLHARPVGLEQRVSGAPLL